MLGRLRMSVDDATQAYAALSDKVFSKKNMKRLKPQLFKTSTLEKALKEIIAEQIKKNQSGPNHPEEAAETIERMMDTQADGGSCKACALTITFLPNRSSRIVVLSAPCVRRTPQLLRSFGHIPSGIMKTRTVSYGRLLGLRRLRLRSSRASAFAALTVYRKSSLMAD